MYMRWASTQKSEEILMLLERIKSFEFLITTTRGKSVRSWNEKQISTNKVDHRIMNRNNF